MLRLFKYYKLILLLVLASVSGVVAQTKKSLTLDEAIQIGLEKSKSLHASRMKVESAVAKVSEAHAYELPILKFGASYSRLSEVPPFTVSLPFQIPSMPNSLTISPAIFDNYNLKLTLQQPLFTGFRLSGNSDLAEYTAQATQHDFEKDKAELIYTVTSAYWNFFKALEFKKVIDENVEQIKAHLNDAENLFSQGMIMNNDVLKVKVQLSEAMLRQIDAKNAAQLTMLSLNNTVGLPLNTEIELNADIQHQPEQFTELQSLIEKAMDKRSDVKAMDYRVKAAESGVILAKSNWWPQIFLVGNYYYNRPNQRILPTVDQFKDTWDVSVALSFDIWNWGATNYQTIQAQVQVAQIQDALGQIKDGITLEVTQSYLTLLQAKEKISVSGQGAQQAEENYRVTNERYKIGLALTSDLLDAEVALLQAKTTHTQTVVDYKLAEARLIKAIGEKSSSPEGTGVPK